MVPGGGRRNTGPQPVSPGDQRGADDEKLPLRAGDQGLTYSRVRALPLFHNISPRVEGRLQAKGGQGAVVLRRFRAGEVICRQGDPGWTAFYLIRNGDLIAMRTRDQEMADAADAKLAARAPELLELPPTERRRRAVDIERGGEGAELADLLFRSAGRPEPGELEALLAEQELLAAGDDADAELEERHPALLELDLAGRRRRAEEIAATDGPLAALLRASATAAERRRCVEVTATPAGRVAVAAPRGGLARLKALLRGRPGRGPKRGEGAIEPVIGTLSEGALFGELACLYHAPRAATVRALRDGYVIELLGHVLRLLLESESFRDDVDHTFRQRQLAQLLRALPVLAGAPDEAIELLRRRAELMSWPPGAVIFGEGEPADSVYLVRTGTVRLVQPSTGGRVLGYRSRGELVGDPAFLVGGRRTFTCVAYEHPRDPDAAQRRATYERRVELVRVDRGLWAELCAIAPSVGEAARRLAATATVATGHGLSRPDELGLRQGRSLMLIDLTRCTRCDECVQACADVQADGRPRLALAGPRLDRYLVPTSCRDCADPVCLVGCPVGSIHRGADGQIVVESWCIGCGLCAAQCPYGAIEVRPLAELAAEAGEEPGGRGRAVAAVCDQCADLRGGPRCVSACAHGAAVRVDGRTFFAGPSSVAGGKS